MVLHFLKMVKKHTAGLTWRFPKIGDPNFVFVPYMVGSSL